MICKNCGHRVAELKMRDKAQLDCFHASLLGISTTCYTQGCNCINPEPKVKVAKK